MASNATSTHTRSLSCIQINLGRRRNSTHELSVHLSVIKNDIIFINEPYTSNTGHFKGFPGYECYQFSSRNTPAPTQQEPIKSTILVKKNLFSTIGNSEYSDPNLCIVKAVCTGGERIFLICVYVEPRVDPNNTLAKLEVFLQQTSGSTHIVCGDFNGWNTAWGSRTNNRRGNLVYDLITVTGLKIINTGSAPTFQKISHNILRESIIDLTLTSNTPHMQATDWQVNCNICPSSDHNAILFNLILGKIQLSKNKKLSTFKYDTQNVKWENIKEQFSNEISRHLPGITQINILTSSQLENYIRQLTQAIQQACDKTLPKSRGPPPRAPWWNDELETLKLKVIHNHHKLRRLVRRGAPLDEVLEERHRLRSEYSESICKESTEHFREFCNRQKKEDVWSITNRIIKTRPLTQPPSTLRKPDGTYTVDSSDTAQALISSFYPDDTPDITNRQKEYRELMATPLSTPSEPPFTPEEVIDALKQMNPKKAPGADHLTADICLHYTENYPEIITAIMNRCLELQYFPKTWKTAYAKIIPKPNKAEYNDTSSFRPIGLINVFGKLLEKLITNRLTYFMNTNIPLCNRQFGFKQQTSSVNALHAALDVVRYAQNQKEHVIMVSLDIKAAFDNAWWPAIFRRLRTINCPSNLYNILLSYIKERTVQINFSDFAASKQMTRGCVQGSVCGPTLWNLILDELLLLNLPKGCYIQAYADDVLLITHSKDINTAETITNTALQQIIDWGKEVKLTFGPTKTQCMAFTRKASKCKIYIENVRIEFVHQFKYLGVIIDDKLRFIKHTEYIIDKAKKLFNKLSIYIRPTWGAHPDNAKTIYLQVIQPIVNYASSVWAGALKYKYINSRLLSLQRLFAIKIIQGFRTNSTAASITLAQLTPLTSNILLVSDIEKTKLKGTSRFLPDDIPIELPAKPSQLLHPSLRTAIKFTSVSTLEEFDSMATELDGAWQIYTDGSKHDEQVGAAFVSANPLGQCTVKKFKLHNCCSVFQAEMLAIQESCKWILQNNINKAFILTDCKSGLEELSNPCSHNQFAVTIHNTIHQARLANNINIQFMWVRGHIGIAGNEWADQAAKHAASLHKTPDFLHAPISHIKRILHAESLEHSKQLFLSTTYTKNLFSSLENLNNYLSLVKPYFAVTQTLTNHGYHKEYLYRFKITPDDKCPCDNVSIQSLTHLIQYCPRFASTRHNHTICSAHLTNPFDLIEIIDHTDTVESYHSHVYHIIKNLKTFNS